MPKVNRENLVHQLEAVRPGLSAKEIQEQTSCFAFRDGMVHTYNDELACSFKCDLKIEGAVPSAPLLTLLSKMMDEEIDIDVEKDELRISGKRTKAGIRMDSKVVLQSINIPKEWDPLPDDFIEAVKIVRECASKEESKFYATCVHFTDRFIEATDFIQVIRYRFKKGLPIKKSFLIRKNSINHVATSDMTSMAESKDWVHFRNDGKLYLSCRRYEEDYPSEQIESILSVSGTPFQLPKGLREAVDRVWTFSSENADNDDVFIELRADRLKVKGTGATGWAYDTKKVKYSGEPVSFGIPPELLMEVTSRYHECEIAPGKLKINGGKYKYVTCLSKAE